MKHREIHRTSIHPLHAGTKQTGAALQQPLQAQALVAAEGPPQPRQGAQGRTSGARTAVSRPRTTSGPRPASASGPIAPAAQKAPARPASRSGPSPRPAAATVSAWPATGRANEDVEMGGIKWTWRTEVKATPDPNLRRVDLRVEKKGDKSAVAFASLSGFISNVGRQATQ